MTVEQIIADCEEHKIALTISHLPMIYKDTGRQWCARIGSLRNMRMAPTFEAAVLAAWAAYTNAEGK